jgi:hypothetical protein
MMSALLVLDYQRRFRLARFRRVGFRFLMAGAIAGGYAAWRQRECISTNFQIFRSRWQCEHFSVASYTPIFERRWGSVNQVTPGSLATWPPCWQELQPNLSVPWFQCDTAIFLHQRISRAGHRRLVAVDFGQGIVQATVVSSPLIPWKVPECVWGNYSNVGPVAAILGEIDIPSAKNAQSQLAGEADADDAAHFTISFVMDGIPGHIDGWLEDDNTVRLCVRNSSQLAGECRRIGLNSVLNDIVTDPTQAWGKLWMNGTWQSTEDNY